MSHLVTSLWLVPALPVAAAGAIALLPRTARKTGWSLAVGALGLSLVISLLALAASIGHERVTVNIPWFPLGDTMFRIGWMLDPLGAVMMAMVCFVGLWIFIFSIGYMADDARQKQFFCYLSLFAGAMLGLLIANHLLVLFMCWELVGLASYLLIGFWFEKPAAAAACRKAFITTRIGDIGFFIGMLWLGKATGTLMFYDDGTGCLEPHALTVLGGCTATGIALLLFCGAAGKSGQVPFHVWLPDAMEGPTPVSALIHAATMVAAGVFLVARVYPLMMLSQTALSVVAGIGALTALIAALIGIAQNDIKRILAYSTVSQLGYMMMALGVGGFGAAIFHLITHGFFKALLFLGSGSVIHGCHGQQDIRAMGGLRGKMKWTFATYAVGMMALAGFPLLFSGFWSKEAILHAAQAWPASRIPFYIGVLGAGLTAFYMTRLMAEVFFGSYRGDDHHPPHESPPVMLWPLAVLAVFSVLLGFLGTQAAPWFQSFVEKSLPEGHEGAHHGAHGLAALLEPSSLALMGVSVAVVALGVGLGWALYGKRARLSAEAPDPLAARLPWVHHQLANRLWFDELYEATVIRLAQAGAGLSHLADRFLWGGCVWLATRLTLAFSRLSRIYDEWLINDGFDRACDGLRGGGRGFSRIQSGKATTYLRLLGVGFWILFVATLVILIKGGGQ